MKPIVIPASRPKRRIGVLPTKTEKSGKDRARERKPKHPHRDTDSEYGGAPVMES